MRVSWRAPMTRARSKCMANFRWDCPHADCRARNAAFSTGFGWYSVADRVNYVPGICGVCQRPTLFVIKSGNGANALEFFQSNWTGDPFAQAAQVVMASKSIGPVQVERTYPDAPQFEAPDHVPPNVGTAYAEGLKALDAGLYSGAAFSIRQSLERAVRVFVPDGNDGLKSRIRRLASAQQLPEALIALAHTVRAEGNVAVHEETWSVSEARQLAHFARLLFVYLFTLPAQVQQVATERGAQAEQR